MVLEMLGVIIGGIISLLTSFVVTFLQNRHNLKLAKQNNSYEIDKWERERKVEVYVRLASHLDDISICVNEETCKIDGQSFEEYRKNLADCIDKYRGEIALFVPAEINIDLMKLRAELFKLATDETEQEIDFSDIANSAAMKTVKHAKSIFTMMQRDLLIRGENK